MAAICKKGIERTKYQSSSRQMTISIPNNQRLEAENQLLDAENSRNTQISADNFTLDQSRANTYFHSSFYPSTIFMWNEITNKARHSKTKQFKALIKIFSTKPKKLINGLQNNWNCGWQQEEEDKEVEDRPGIIKLISHSNVVLASAGFFKLLYIHHWYKKGHSTHTN